MKRKIKTPKYISQEEAVVLKNKKEKYLQKLKAKLYEVENKYLEIGKRNKRNLGQLKALDRLSTKQRKLATKIQKCVIDIENIDNGKYLKLNIFQKLIKYFRSLSYANQKIVCGIILVLPWFIGLCFFFIKPLFTTIYWSFNTVTPIAGGLEISFAGISNYINLFTTQMLGNRIFTEVLTLSIKDMAYNTSIIFIFSLLVAVVLNTKFKGHQIFKAIFFIPVVYNVSIINSVLEGTFGGYISGNTAGMATLLDSFSNYLLQIGLAEGLITFLIGAVNRIFTIVNTSGIQILIFIAALQSIPKHLYEAAKVEGATTYECFWKITVPMVSPMFLPVLVFTIVDSFASSELIQIMTRTSDGTKIAYGMSSTIAVVYFIVNFLIIGILFLILRKLVYNNER